MAIGPTLIMKRQTSTTKIRTAARLTQEDTSVTCSLPEYQELVQKLEADLRLHIRREQELEIRLEQAEGNIEDLERIKESLAASSKQIVEDIRRDNRSLIDLLKVKETALGQLRSQVEDYRKVLEMYEMKVQTIPHLEIKLKELERNHQSEVAKITAKHRSVIEQSSKELKQLNSVISANEGYSDTIKQLMHELSNYKRASSKSVEAEQKVQRAESVLSSKARSLQEAEQKVSRLELQASAKDKEIEALKQTVAELTETVNRLKKQRTTGERSIKLESPLHIKAYKQRLKEKDEELSKLKKRLGRMYSSEAKVKIKELNFEEERQIYQERLGKIFESTQQLEYNLTYRENPRRVLERTEDEAGNIREIARSSAEAYDKLLISMRKSQEPKKSNRVFRSVSDRLTKSTRPQTAGTSRLDLSGAQSSRRFTKMNML
jgi:chromosome segregation ATPase